LTTYQRIKAMTNPQNLQGQLSSVVRVNSGNNAALGASNLMGMQYFWMIGLGAVGDHFLDLRPVDSLEAPPGRRGRA
jgi:hypothetical protein